jgi:Domain of unknown function (DUF5666)
VRITVLFRRSKSPSFAATIFLTCIAAVCCATGCGAGGKTPGGPVFSGTTNVTVLLSSTANDQLSQFNIGFTSLTLTSQAGKTVNIFSTSQNAELIHLNGAVEPLLAVTVPQGIYTSATAVIGPASFTCVTIDPSQNNLATSTFAYGATPSAQVAVNLPAPITITGTAMGLSLTMLVSQSATFSNCEGGAGVSYAITPTFNVTPVAFSPQVVEPGLDGEISAINAADNNFTLTLPDGQALRVNANDNTIYQGINGFSLLSAGTFVDMDAAIQSDGSQLATRIAVEDTNTTNLSVSTGPVLQIAASQPTLFALEPQHEGFLTTANEAGVFMPYSFGNVAFQISGRLNNLQDLPFSTSFDAGSLFPGQAVYTTSHAVTVSGGPTYVPATTITMIPQTINGTITGTSTNGGFTTYNVTLEAYDLIPKLAVQPGQTSVLTDPSNVVVYVDSNTLTQNTLPLNPGSVMRFNGMLFNDNGSLRMDCGQVNDGVTP